MNSKLLSELLKGIVLTVGLVLLLFAMAVLAPQARADSLNVSQVAHYLDTWTALPLAPHVDRLLASNLLDAQELAWGTQWQEGSLLASENAVLKAITLYVWPGGPAAITVGGEPLVWVQSNISIDTTLSVGFGTDSLNFGEQPITAVVTPEPATLAMLLAGIVGLWLGWYGTRRTLAHRMRARLASYRPRVQVRS